MHGRPLFKNLKTELTIWIMVHVKKICLELDVGLKTWWRYVFNNEEHSQKRYSCRLCISAFKLRARRGRHFHDLRDLSHSLIRTKRLRESLPPNAHMAFVFKARVNTGTPFISSFGVLRLPFQWAHVRANSAPLRTEIIRKISESNSMMAAKFQ